jgi:hypothetical protein
MRAGLPVVMMEASGPGTISFSHDIAGEMLALPVQAGGAVDVREHQLVAATVGVGYDWYDSGIWFTTRGDADGMQSGAGGLLKMGLDLAGGGGGSGLAGALGGGGLGGALGGALGGSAGRRDDRQANQDQTYYPAGWHVDRFTAGEKPGVVFVQCGGNAFVRDLAEGEQILVKPPAFLFKDPVRRYPDARRVPGGRDEALADLGQPLPVAAGVGAGPDRPAIQLRPPGRPRYRLPGELPVHPAPLVSRMWTPQAEPRPITWASRPWPLDLAVPGLAAQVVADLPDVGDAGGRDRVALGLQAARHVHRGRAVAPGGADC